MEELTARTNLKEIEDDDADFIEETFGERLLGLTEMFPESVRGGCSKATQFTIDSTKLCFQFSKSAAWVLSSTFAILMLPVIFETERSAMQEQQRQQQTQMLLGPNAALSGSGAGSTGMIPSGMMPPGLATAGPPQ